MKLQPHFNEAIMALHDARKKDQSNVSMVIKWYFDQIEATALAATFQLLGVFRAHATCYQNRVPNWWRDVYNTYRINVGIRSSVYLNQDFLTRCKVRGNSKGLG